MLVSMRESIESVDRITDPEDLLELIKTTEPGEEAISRVSEIALQDGFAEISAGADLL